MGIIHAVTGEAIVLDGNDIQTFGIVAYGRDFISDVSVSNIIFYY